MANATWAIDPSHSEIQFKVKHLVITTVTGNFKEFSVLLSHLKQMLLQSIQTANNVTVT
jgi:polyisoprenoid-binding protein YceI